MKLVEQYLHKHHLLHAPHKWFLAALSSPLHVAEMHYKQKYHLSFRHAKKLFVFDILLLLSIAVLSVGTIFWFTYDPTVTSLVRVEISADHARIESGEDTTYRVDIENNSSVSLQQPTLALSFPKGFILNTTTLPEAFDTKSHTLRISTIVPGASTAFTFSGTLYATPHEEDNITATLSYTQTDREQEEIKVARIVQTLRGSTLSITSTLPEVLVNQGNADITITLRNQGQQSYRAISVPLTLPEGISLQTTTSTLGSVQTTLWSIPELKPQEQATLTATIRSGIADTVSDLSFRFTPQIQVNGHSFAQESTEQRVRITHPELFIATRWDTASISPGTNARFTIDIANNGDSALDDLSLYIPLDTNTINLSTFRQENTGTYTGNTFIIQQAHHAGLAHLEPGESRSITLIVPIKQTLSGKDIRVTLSPTVQATIPGLPQHPVEKTVTSEAMNVGTSLTISASSRYYTNEGDQLGRGPLPPQVGKETKYWAIIRVQNTTSRVRDIVLTTTLPEGVVWTDRHSVSHGAPLQYNPATKQIRWELKELWPGQVVGVNTELSITPTEAQRGTILPLLGSIRVEGFDTFIQTSLSKTHAGVDTSLPDDTLGQQKGHRVQ